jgi:hypothetical protein
MMQIALIGLGAGAASALVFASVKSGALLSIFLFYLAPLPILIAALGWSHVAAIFAAMSAAIVLGLLFGSVYLFVFLLSVGLPAWWLGYLAMLARPMPDGTLEWYPPGRLVVWIAVIGAMLVVAAMPTFGFDEESFRNGLRAALRPMVERMMAGDGTSNVNVDRMTDLMALILPPTASVLATVTLSANLWIAARVVSFSGRLNRPWPNLSAMTFPPLVSAALLAAIIASLLGGLLGIAGTALAATLLMAFAILGFAVLHAITRGASARPFILSGTYAATLVIGWPVLAMTLLGLADAAFGIRARVAQKRGALPPD